METVPKQKLKDAYEAGQRSVKLNQERDELLERGTFQICEEYTFDNWLKNQDLEKRKSPTWKDYFDLAESVANEYSELKKLFKSSIGSAQICDAMENFHKKAKELES